MGGINHMFLLYIDESGDDGFPGSSDSFINTAIQVQSENWNSIDKKFNNFRRKLATSSKLPYHLELHVNNIIGRKSPYTSLSMTDDEIKNLIRDTAKIISGLDILCTSIVVDKTRLNKSVNIFDIGVHHLVNRINTTISVKYKSLSFKEKSFLIFCDQGRLSNWETLVSSMKKQNVLYNAKSSKQEIFKLNKLIEDPIQRDSRKSNFLQIADFIVTIFNKYHQLAVLNRTFRSRMAFIDLDFITEILEILKPVLNLDATKDRKHYGAVYFPKIKNTT